MCVSAGSKKGVHLKAGLVFRSKHAPTEREKSAEIVIIKKVRKAR